MNIPVTPPMWTCAACNAHAPSRFTDDDRHGVYMLMPEGWNARVARFPGGAQYEPVCDRHPEQFAFHVQFPVSVIEGLPFDPKHDQDAPCSRPGCDAPYYRHFDWMENYRPGCKYCCCPAFVEPGVKADPVPSPYVGCKTAREEREEADPSVEIE